MPLRKFRDKRERVLTDESSEDEDEEEKELFEEFELLEDEEVKKIDEYLRKFNRPEVLQKENQRMDEGPSQLVISKKKAEDGAQLPSSLDDFMIL